MRVPTVEIRHKETGEKLIVNQVDFDQGSLTGERLMDAGGYERIGGETIGELLEADRKIAEEEQKETADVIEAQVAKGAALDVAAGKTVEPAVAVALDKKAK